MATQAKLQVLKAASVTIPLVREVERHFPDGHSGACFLRNSIQAFVVTANDQDGGLDDFIRGAVAHLDRNLPSAPAMNGREKARVDALMACLSERAQQAPSSSLSSGIWLFVPELGEAFDFAIDLASDLLALQDLVLPIISRSTSFSTDMSASCRIADSADSLQNDVTLILPEQGFNKRSLYAAPYLLTHEMVCHASQGVSGPFPREGSGANCAWSDGWMDCVAYEEAYDLLVGRDIAQEWINEARPAVAQRAETAHVARFSQVPSSKSEEANRSARIQAKEAWIGLKLAAMEGGRNELEADSLRRAFSLRYNALNVSYGDRQALVMGLWVKSFGLEGRQRALAAIETFLESPNPAALHRAVAL